jgi:hypothetical protein
MACRRPAEGTASDSLVGNEGSVDDRHQAAKWGTAMTVRLAESASGPGDLGPAGVMGPAGCLPAHTAAPRPEVLVGRADPDSPFVPPRIDAGEHSRRPPQRRTHREFETALRAATVTAHAPTTTHPLRTRRREPQRPRDRVLQSLQGPTTAAGDADHGDAGSHFPRHQRYSGKFTPYTDVAWQLAEAASPCLRGHERTMTFVELGCGENHLAAERILIAVIRNGFPLPATLLTTLTTWLDLYVGTRGERRLRALLERVSPRTCEGAIPAMRKHGDSADADC